MSHWVPTSSILTSHAKTPISPSPAANTNITSRVVILRATVSEVVGASLRVGGLTVLERSLKQLERLGVTILVASDGSCPLPKYLPPLAVVRKVPRPEDLTALRKEQPTAIELGANEVRPSLRTLEGGLRVTDEKSRRKAEAAIFADLMRGDLGYVARHFNKPVSFFLTRHFFCHLPITPNQVTLGAALVGLFGMVLIASGDYALMVWGFFLAHLQSILDGCDGELARVRFQQSAVGEWLDTIVDDGLNIILFTAIGMGLFRAGGDTTALTMGLFASGMHLVYDIVALSEIRRQGEGGEIIRVRWRLVGKDDMKSRLSKNHKSVVARFYALGRRDFFVLAFLIYALLRIPKLALIHALIISFPLFVIALAQVVWRLRGSPTR